LDQIFLFNFDRNYKVIFQNYFSFPVTGSNSTMFLKIVWTVILILAILIDIQNYIVVLICILLKNSCGGTSGREGGE
jgi:hypothetical protein